MGGGARERRQGSSRIEAARAARARDETLEVLLHGELEAGLRPVRGTATAADRGRAVAVFVVLDPAVEVRLVPVEALHVVLELALEAFLVLVLV